MREEAIAQIQAEYDQAYLAVEAFRHASSNSVLAGALRSIFLPDERDLAKQAAAQLIAAYEVANGCASLSATVSPDILRSLPLPFEAARLYGVLVRRHPPATLQAATWHRLIDTVRRNLGLLNPAHNAPRLQGGRWVLTSYGRWDTMAASGAQRMTYETQSHLYQLLPHLAEILTPEGDSAVDRVIAARAAVQAWDRAGRPGGRSDFPEVLGIVVRFYKEKIEIGLSAQDAERLQVALFLWPVAERV